MKLEFVVASVENAVDSLQKTDLTWKEFMKRLGTKLRKLASDKKPCDVRAAAKFVGIFWEEPDKVNYLSELEFILSFVSL